jgi:hypothetical protein
MPKSKDQSKSPSGPKLDRRALIRGALAAGGAAAVAHGASLPQTTVPAEREWARVLARHVSNQLQEAALHVPNLGLSGDQIEQLRQAFENTLVTNMGCESPPS